MAVKYKAGKAFPIGATNKEAETALREVYQSLDRVRSAYTREVGPALGKHRNALRKFGFQDVILDIEHAITKLDDAIREVMVSM